MKKIKVNDPLNEAHKSAKLVALQLGQTVSVTQHKHLPFMYLELLDGTRLARFERK